MSSHVYATDLTDAEWKLIQPLVPAPSHTGRQRHYPWRTLRNAIFYQLLSVRRAAPAPAPLGWRSLPRGRFRLDLWPTRANNSAPASGVSSGRTRRKTYP